MGFDDTTHTSFRITYRTSAASDLTSAFVPAPPLLLRSHALPRAEQLAELARLAIAGRYRSSPLERARFGWYDAPRRPCYRAPRSR